MMVAKPPMLIAEYELPMRELVHQWTLEMAKASEPLLQEISGHSVDHLPDQSSPEGVGAGGFYLGPPHTSTIEISFDSLRGTDLEEWWLGIFSAGESLGTHMVKHIFETMKKVCAKTGNIVKSDGEPISHDRIIDMIEMLDLEVDENLQFKSPPKIVLSPEAAGQLENLGPLTAEQEERFRKIMLGKLEKQRAEKRTRKLD